MMLPNIPSFWFQTALILLYQGLTSLIQAV